MSSSTLATLHPTLINSKTTKLSSPSSFTKLNSPLTCHNEKKKKNEIVPGLPFNFLNSLNISQENQPKKISSSSLQLPNLDKLNIGSKKVDSKNGILLLNKDPRPVLSEVNKIYNALPKTSTACVQKSKSYENNEILILANKIIDSHYNHSFEMLACHKNNASSSLREATVKNLLSSRLDLKPQFAKNTEMSFDSSSSQNSESHSKSAPKKLFLRIVAKTENNNEAHALTDHLLELQEDKEEIKDEVNYEIKALCISDPCEVSSFGCTLGYQWRPLNPQPLEKKPPEFWHIVSKLYANFNPHVLTAYEVQKKEEERRLQKDWKKNQTLNRTKKEQPRPSLAVDPFAHTGTFRFQFKGGQGC